MTTQQERLRSVAASIRTKPTPLSDFIPLMTKTADRIDKLEAENDNLRTVMMAAAVEIQEHWDAHCDADGYGPANLMRRLEGGYPEQYGYNAETVVRLEAEIERLRRAAERYRWLAKYLVSDDESHDDAIVAATTVAELDYVIDAAMKGTP